jgi:cytochrome b6-f complex iron-sulfur subunit
MAIAAEALVGQATRLTGAPRAAATGGVATRRNVLAWSGWATLGVVALQAVVAFVVYFWPRKMGASGITVRAGSPTDYREGDVRYFADGRFYLVRLAEGFVALSQKCPHLGCAVPWRPEFEFSSPEITARGVFLCPCHGSTYLPNGQVIKGPAERSMDLMAIRLANGQLVVDTGTVKKRQAWHPRQAFVA